MSLPLGPLGPESTHPRPQFAMAMIRFSLVSTLAVLAPLASAVQGTPAGYYDTVDATDATTLRSTLHAVIDDHTRIPYTSASKDTWDVLERADEDPSASGRILDVYKNESYAKVGGGNPDYNREHTWPNSYGFPDDGSSNYPYTDCHGLFLCDSGYNSARSNKPYRYCDSACNENETIGGGTGVYPGNSNWESGFDTQGTWEAWNGRRGDCARAILYMDIRYEGGFHAITGHAEPDLIVTDSEALIDASSTGSNESIAYMGMKSVLLLWHTEDPPDQKEMDRNDEIFIDQGNRNPFIDHPEWVGLMWPTGGGTPTADPWINEFHYDNSGADVGEFVEIAGPAGLDVTGYRVIGYNGAGGGEYDAETLAGVIPDQQDCIGTLSVAFVGLQNGAPDGICLVNNLNQVIEFISYEGAILATDGPADGMTSVDIGIAESSSTVAGDSLQLIGTGASSGDFTWSAQAESPGSQNSGQTFSGGCDGTVTFYGCGINPAGSLTVVSGAPTIGTTLTLGVDNPLGTQAVGSLPFLTLAFTPDPSFPCGLPVPGFGMAAPGAVGELLIGFLPPNPFATIAGTAWAGAGSPAPIPVVFPNNPALVGFSIFAQGILLDIGGAIPFGVTEAAELSIGQ